MTSPSEPLTVTEINLARWRIRRGLDIRVGDACPICVQTYDDPQQIGRVTRLYDRPHMGGCSLRAYHLVESLDDSD